MDSSRENQGFDDRFAVPARQFCAVVDAASSLSRKEFLNQVYLILPKLIDQGICMPDVELDDSNEEATDHASRQGHQEWKRPFDLLREKLGDWDSYRLFFDPIGDTESIKGSLADDLADIYHDLKEMLVENEAGPLSPEDRIWEWRFSFRTHWGKHAIDALNVIHILHHYR
ncbi:MAG: DUF5063 domain-containing protein [Terracidiphilus sp.]|jgi:hypothetical protein